jgi:asparagine synthase (glutamine-hydrolysing)
MPSYKLSYGTNDRALARDLFADILPTSIARRRGKGEVSSYYRRALVENLPFLRPFLLDGTLAAHGFLDADTLDELMTDETLMAPPILRHASCAMPASTGPPT